MAQAWNGRSARPVPEIPAKPVWNVFKGLEEYERMSARKDMLPIGYDEADASVYGVSLADTFCYGIYGGAQTGKTNLLKACVLSALDKHAEICVVDSEEHELGMFEDHDGVHYILSDAGLEGYLRTVIPDFTARRNRKEELAAQGKEADEVFDVMSSEFKPIFFFLPELDQFINMIYRSEINLAPLFENVISKGSGNNIYFFADMSVRNRSNAGGRPAFESFIRYRKGIHMGGKISDGSILDFENMPYSEQTKALKAGTGLVKDAESMIRKIVTPLVKMSDIKDVRDIREQ
jgi:S-DNA-T family DNA segregation ATPase FtsK/SpoIIIE